MGGRFSHRSVSLMALAAAIAAQGSAASAQEAQRRDEQPEAAPATATQISEAKPASVAPPDAEIPAQEVTETIVVTGSRIPRPNLTAVSPLTVIGDQEVKLEGAIMAEELLNQLPQVAPSQGAFISNGATGTSTVDLRNLGASRTLVLINGRRLGPGDPTSPVADLNIVPTSLIKRVEVLTGGASSVYGSDAVSGVINFILDTKLNGFRVDGQGSVFQHDNRNGSGLRDALEQRGIGLPSGNAVDGGRQDVNMAFGKGFFEERAHVTLYAGYRNLTELRQDARDYSACAAQVNMRDNTLLECGGSPASFPGNFVTNFGAFQIGPDRTFQPGFDRFNFGPFNFYQRPGRRYTAGGFANFDISAGFKPYAEVMYLDDRSLAQTAPSGNFGRTQSVNCDNPLLSDQQRSLVCFTGNFVGEFPIFDDDGNLIGIQGSPTAFIDPVTGSAYNRGFLIIGRRNVEGGPRQEDLRHKTIRLLGGFKGDLGRGITYDASYLYGRAGFAADFRNDFSVTRLRRSLDVISDPMTGDPACRSVLTGQDPNCVPYDIFALGGVTPEAAAYLAAATSRHGSVTERVANANATIDLGEWNLRSPWADEAPAINFGAEHRKNSLDYRPDPLALTGDLAGTLEDFPVNGSVAVKELFAETRIPLVAGRIIERLAFEGGYRQSWYDNGESRFSTNAYKYALDLTAVRGLRFRGSLQRAVRAPNIVELFSPPISSGFRTDPCAGPTPQATQAQCAATGVSAAQYGKIFRIPGAEDSFQSYNAIVGGNPQLEPEKATTRTLGVVLEPRFLPGLNATVDWWDIDLNGAIQQIDAQIIVDTCIASADPLFCRRINRDADGSLFLSPQGFVDDRLANIGSVKVRGIDVGVNYNRELGQIGSASVGFLGSYLDRFIVDNGGLSTPQDCAGKYGFLCGSPTPRWRHKARLTWEGQQGVALSFHWRHIGRMSVKPIPGLPPPGPLSARLPAQNYFDLSALVRFQRKLVLRFGVNNIFDREPPLVPFGEGGGSGSGNYNGNTYPQWYDPLGRFFFAGFTFNL